MKHYTIALWLVRAGITTSLIMVAVGAYHLWQLYHIDPRVSYTLAIGQVAPAAYLAKAAALRNITYMGFAGIVLCFLHELICFRIDGSGYYARFKRWYEKNKGKIEEGLQNEN